MNKAIFALCAFLVLPVMGLGQNWSGILASSRAINWGANAGLPATFLDGETTPNAWTPPTRTQCGSTVAAGTSFATINSDLAACAAGTYLLLGPGTFSSSSTNINLVNNVTLRGSGADQTFITCSATCAINFKNTSASSIENTWTGGLSQGSTSLTFGGNAGLAAGQLTILYGLGSTTDTGGVYVCSTSGTCSQSGGNGNQSQTVLITGGSGNTWTISPSVYMPNWGTGVPSPTETWETTTVGAGLEDIGFDFTGNTNQVQITLGNCYACWIKGNRIINGYYNQVDTKGSKSYLIANNYFYGATTLVSNPPAGVTMDTDSDGLVINNFTQLSTFYWQGGAAGDVIAYNYQRDAYSNSGSQIYPPVIVEHESGGSFLLEEGNENSSLQMDNCHGTQNLDTFFRNLAPSNDPPYPSPGNVVSIMLGGIARFMNVVGNVLGSAETTTYKSTPSNPQSNAVLSIGIWSAGPTDTLAVTSSLLWGNYDVVTGAVRWCGNSSDTGWSAVCGSTSEVPTTLTGTAVPFENPVPTLGDTGAGQGALPASFFMPTTAYPNGGTGLSWWKVCTNYPECSTTQTQPFPTFGPDVTGGGPVIGNTTDIYAGHAYDIPAALAWKTLPIDTSYQASYSITGSSWSSGKETLTISGGFPGGFTPKGEFQVTGTCAGTFVMNGSSNTTVSYALSSNPGSCSGGSLKYPDVRQFNEKVYENDTSVGPAPPTGLQAVVH